LKHRNGPLGPTIAIVLGAGINGDGIASPRTRVRAEAAARLAHANPELTLIVTGDGRSKSRMRYLSLSEASNMAKILIKSGIAPNRILREHQACDTIGNAILSAARYLVDQEPRQIYVVTSPFHAERALTIFRGVLGPAWTVEAYLSEEIEGDAVKGANESGGIEWAHRFFEQTIPGNIASAINRLLAIGKPRYRQFRWLKHMRIAA
jgi:uncharacterized SAM-binding protein YcdF (DUF218 family)